jgi:uncharacterized tellurite resistance protein B-like protein
LIDPSSRGVVNESPLDLYWSHVDRQPHESPLDGWLDDHRDRPYVLVAGDAVIARWGGGRNVENDVDALAMLEALEGSGIGIEPDPRLAGHFFGPNEPVLLFDLPAGDSGFPSQAYRAGAAVVRLGIVVAASDGKVVDEEKAALRERAAHMLGLSTGEQQRLRAYAEWLIQVPAPLDVDERDTVATWTAEDRRLIGHFLVAVAGADHHVAAPEHWVLKGIFGVLGLTQSDLSESIASLTAHREPVDSGCQTEAVKSILNSTPSVTTVLSSLAAPPAQQSPKVMPAPGPREASWGIRQWEDWFAGQWKTLQTRGAGGILGLIPDHARWEAFARVWRERRPDQVLERLEDYPHALIALIDGLAFFAYDEGRYWPQFGREIWPVSLIQQGRIRAGYKSACDQLRLPFISGKGGELAVATAVYQIGIPISMWADALEFAESILRKPGWTSWDSRRWTTEVENRTPTRPRLRAFLTNNEAAAREIVAEMGEVRELARVHPEATIADLRRLRPSSPLRDEYFDDVPETADFLRPGDPMSLLAHLPFVGWDREKLALYLNLPAVPKSHTSWIVNGIRPPARATPIRLRIGRAAFVRRISVTLDGPEPASFDLEGIDPWGILNLSRGRLVRWSAGRDITLVSDEYMLVRERPFESIELHGFDTRNYDVNSETRLSDGSSCFVSVLSPERDDAWASVGWQEGQGGAIGEQRIDLRPRRSIGRSTAVDDGSFEHIPTPSLPWFFLKPGPYRPMRAADLKNDEQIIQIVRGGSPLARERLARYQTTGVVAATRDSWRIDCERLLIEKRGESVVTHFYGLPSHLWALRMKVGSFAGVNDCDLPADVEIVELGELAAMRMTWPSRFETAIKARAKDLVADVIAR